MLDAILVAGVLALLLVSFMFISGCAALESEDIDAQSDHSPAGVRQAPRPGSSAGIVS